MDEYNPTFSVDSKFITLLGDWAPEDMQVQPLAIDNPLIVNMEGPILCFGSGDILSRPKAGPVMSNQQMPTFVNASGKFISVLANNHSMDFGEIGLSHTIDFLKDANSHIVGAGEDVQSAYRPLIFEWCGRRVALLSRCETQFGSAAPGNGGVAALNEAIYQEISDLKQNVDYVILSIHAAAEMCAWPSVKRQKLYRSFIDAGADLIHGHHSHVPQGWEEYKGAYIFYGLGNFCVKPEKWDWHPHCLWSVTPKIWISDDRINIEINTSVIRNVDKKIVIRPSVDSERKIHEDYLEACNFPLAKEDLLEALWQEFSIEIYSKHFQEWLGFRGRFSLLRSLRSVIKRRLVLIKRLVFGQSIDAVKRKDYLMYFHLFACESHNDAISTALGVLGGELRDCRTAESKKLYERLIYSV